MWEDTIAGSCVVKPDKNDNRCNLFKFYFTVDTGHVPNVNNLFFGDLPVPPDFSCSMHMDSSFALISHSLSLLFFTFDLTAAIEFFLNGVELSLNSVNMGNLINQ